MAKARIAVIGAGLMGHGIAQVFALAGHDVTIYDSGRGEPRQRQGAHSRKSAGISATIKRRSSACVRPPISPAAVRDADYVGRGGARKTCR